jgi:hypothetical protein
MLNFEIVPLRFRRSLRLLPGVRLNISKTGTSVSVGGRGGTVNFSKRGVYGTVGLPGTGISWRERLDTPRSSARRAATRSWLFMGVVVVAAIVWALMRLR